MAVANNSEEKKNKRVPILFLLDVSGSMEFGIPKSRLELMNQAVKTILERFIDRDKVRGLAEVSFVLFTDKILLESEFQNIRYLSDEMFPKFRNPQCGKVLWRTGHAYKYKQKFLVPYFSKSTDQGGTDIGKAMVTGINKLMDRVETLKAMGSYPAILILMTDGHPREPDNPGYWEHLASQQEAKLLLSQHDRNYENDPNNLIVPILVGVGDDHYLGGKPNDARGRLLDLLGEGNDPFYFPVRDNEAAKSDWEFAADIIAQSVSNSINWDRISIKDFKKVFEDERNMGVR